MTILDAATEAVIARAPDEVRAAFDAAVDARQRFRASHDLSGREAIDARSRATVDLEAANRVLGDYDWALPQYAARVAQGGA